MNDKRVVLCAASYYSKKYYFNQDFDQLPEEVRNELKILCVTHTEEVGGTLSVGFEENGTIFIEVKANEEDLLYDEIGSHLKVKQKQREKKELWEALETYFRIFYLGEG